MHTHNITANLESSLILWNFRMNKIVSLYGSHFLKFISSIFAVPTQHTIDVLARKLLMFPFDWCGTQTFRSMAPFTGHAEINAACVCVWGGDPHLALLSNSNLIPKWKGSSNFPFWGFQTHWCAELKGPCYTNFGIGTYHSNGFFRTGPVSGTALCPTIT